MILLNDELHCHFKFLNLYSWLYRDNTYVIEHICAHGYNVYTQPLACYGGGTLDFFPPFHIQCASTTFPAQRLWFSQSSTDLSSVTQSPEALVRADTPHHFGCTWVSSWEMLPVHLALQNTLIQRTICPLTLYVT